MDYFFAVISKAIKGYMFKINNNNIVIFENDLGFFIFFFIFTLFYKFTSFVAHSALHRLPPQWC